MLRRGEGAGGRRQVTTATGAGGWRAAVPAMVFGLALLAVQGAGPAVAGPQGSADLEWAQQRLKEQGFDPGRPNGELTPRTRAALSAYQRSVGLPATGEPDGATIARLMAGNGAGATVGNLAAPGHAHGPAGHEAVAPTPHAAPSGRVAAGGGTGDTPVYGGGTGAGGGAVPKAAPSGTVTAASELSPPALPDGTPSPAATGASSLVLTVPAWLRDGVVGVIAAVIGGFALLWWWSGRRPARGGPPLSVEADAPMRIEPRFGPPGHGQGGGGGQLRAERFR